MGQICCNESTKVNENAHSDRAPLIISNEVVPNNTSCGNHMTNESNHGDDYRNLANNILKEAENHMVSANTGDLAVLDIIEVEDRQRFYSAKTKCSGRNLPSFQILPKVNGNPNIILAKVSLSNQDLAFIRNLAHDNAVALTQMLEPDSEELVVDFAAI